MKGTRAPFGVICWTPAAHIDEAIRLVRALDDQYQAIELASTSCHAGERWAVVDLASMTVVAEGAGVARRDSGRHTQTRRLIETE